MSIGSNIPSLQVTDTALTVTVGAKTETLEKSKFGIIGWLFGQNVGIQLDYMKNGKEVKGEWVYIKKSSVDRFNQKTSGGSTTAEGPGHTFVNKLISLYRDSKTTQVELPKDKSHEGVARLTVKTVFVLSPQEHINLKSFLSKYGLKLPDGYAPGAVLGPDARAQFIHGLEKANPNKNENDWKIIHQQIDGYFGALSDEVKISPNPLRASSSTPSPAPSPGTVDAVEVEVESSPTTKQIPYNQKYVLSGDVSEGAVSRAGLLVESFTSSAVSVADLVRKFTAHIDWASTTLKKTNYQHFHQVAYLLGEMSQGNSGAVMEKLCKVAKALPLEGKMNLDRFLDQVKENNRDNTAFQALIETFQGNLRPSAAK
jgi:hypothetical protein